jgi:hypothetical protein
VIISLDGGVREEEDNIDIKGKVVDTVTVKSGGFGKSQRQHKDESQCTTEKF